MNSILAISIMALTFMALIFGLTLAIASSQDRIIKKARTSTRTVKRIGGYILLVIGVWTLALALFANFFSTIFPV